MDYSPPGSSVHGISQARILEWVAISFSRIKHLAGYNSLQITSSQEIAGKPRYSEMALFFSFCYLCAHYWSLPAPDAASAHFWDTLSLTLHEAVLGWPSSHRPFCVSTSEAVFWPDHILVVSLASIPEAGLEIDSLLKVIWESEFC